MKIISQFTYEINTASPNGKALVSDASKNIAVEFIDWSNIANKPSTFTPSSHNHDASDLATGQVSLARGGTGNDLNGASAWSAVFVNASNQFASIAPNTSSTRKYLGMTGTGSGGQTPTWTGINTSEIDAGTLPIGRGGTNNNILSGVDNSLARQTSGKYDTLAHIRATEGELIVEENNNPAGKRLKLTGIDGKMVSEGTSMILNAGSTGLYLQVEGNNILSLERSGSTNKFAFFGASTTAQRAHVNDPSGGSTVDTEARTAINSILVTLENFGLHATS